MKIDTLAAKNRIDVSVLSRNDPRWAQLTPRQPLSLVQSREWKELVEHVFKHKAVYFVVSRGGQPFDILPLFLVQMPLIGKKLVSTPYEGCFGGLQSESQEVHQAVFCEVLRLAHEQKVRYVEVRSQRPLPHLASMGFLETTPLLVSEISLSDLSSNWSSLSAKHRRNVRSAEKRGVTCRLASHRSQMKAFYRISADHFQSMGLPFPAGVYFDQIWDRLVSAGHASLLLAEKGDALVGGHLLFHSGDVLISKYSACRKDPEFRNSYASYSLFWEGIRHGVENGFKTFNMGVTGSSNSGLLDFKNRFGAQSQYTNFYYFPIRGELPDFGELYTEYQTLKSIWKILPSRLTTPIGHQINRWFC